MGTDSAATDYGEFARKVYANYGKHERHVQELGTNVSLMPLADFHAGYKEEVDFINSQTTPVRYQNNTVQDFADIFEVFDRYPANLAKVRKPPGREPLQRHNSTLGETRRHLNSQTSCDETLDLQSTAPVVSAATATTTYPSASETRKQFKKFQASLQKLIAEMECSTLAAMYKEQLGRLQVFADQLNKLTPSSSGAAAGSGTELAISGDEEQLLTNMLGYMDDLHAIVANDTSGHQVHQQRERLHKMMEIVLYTLTCISAYHK